MDMSNPLEMEQQKDLENREQKVVQILKNMDMGMHDHEDILFLAAELGVSKHFYN